MFDRDAFRRISLSLSGLLLVVATTTSLGQTALQQKIQTIAADAHGTVSVACALPKTSLNCDLNPHGHPPMQSVFKLPLAITVLHAVEGGSLSLDQPIRFLPSDLFVPKAYSPLQDKYPDANVDVPLRELLRLSVSLSDNAAADILLRLIGGPKVVDSYIRSLGVQGFHLQDGEHELHRDATAQYRNWFEPAGAVQLLLLINSKSPLTPEHTQLLLEWMNSKMISSRIAGDLPAGATVMHKSGTSGVIDGVTAATNDIGLITLPNGKRLAIAIFVTDAKADAKTRDAVIARVARAAYDAGIADKNKE